MSATKRTFRDLSFEEKLTVVEDYLDSVKQTDNPELLADRMEWLRRHIPSFDSGNDGNYVFVSYSHRDFKKVYNDLAFFLYNNQRKVRFWYDEGLPAGDDWFRAAREHLSAPNCVGVIFYLSENFLRSSAVLQEIELVKELGKPYFTITLEKNKFCAADYLDEEKDAELLSHVSSVFPREETSVSYESASEGNSSDGEKVAVYNDEYEDAFYRIRKIENAFSVTEEVFSDFICEEVGDGLCLTGYRGSETNVYIPERIGRLPIVEISASFDNVKKIYIPSTVIRISPALLEEELEGFVREDENTWSILTASLQLIGGYRSPGALFGAAKNLEQIEVAPDNPVFYDTDGILFSRDGKLVRVPANHPWDDKYLDGIETVGMSAFYGYSDPQTGVKVPDSVISIEANAFAYSSLMFIDLSAGIKSVGESAFAFCELMLPVSIPETVCELGEFVFRGARMDFAIVDGNGLETLPRGTFFAFKGDYISISDTIKIIGVGAFMLCSELDDLKLPEGVKAIDALAFYGCAKLPHINIPRGLIYLSNLAFGDNDRLRYIFYDGTARDFYYLRMTNEIEGADFADLFITREDWLRRLGARISTAARKQMTKILEKTNNNEEGKSKSPLGKITFSNIFSFFLGMLIFIAMDYRRLVLKKPEDWVYWLLAAIGTTVIYMGSKHLYWSHIVNKHKKILKANGKPRSDFLDAICNVLSIVCITVCIYALISPIIVSGLFNLSFLRDWFASLGDL